MNEFLQNVGAVSLIGMALYIVFLIIDVFNKAAIRNRRIDRMDEYIDQHRSGLISLEERISNIEFMSSEKKKNK